MFRTISKQTRPNTNVEFFNPKTSTLLSDDVKNYIGATYIATGKIVHSDETLSDDGLVLTLTATFADEAAYTAWTTDSFVVEQFHGIGMQYREANGITSVIESAQTI